MMDRRAQTHVIFLDFATASDTVFHSSFMTELSAVNLSPNGLSWIHAFLTNRLQYSFVNNTFSNYCPVTSCSPQGSVIAPPFFFLCSLAIFPIAHLPQFTSLPLTAPSIVQSRLHRTPFPFNMTLTHFLPGALTGVSPATLTNAAAFLSPVFCSHRITHTICLAPF